VSLVSQRLSSFLRCVQRSIFLRAFSFSCNLYYAKEQRKETVPENPIKMAKLNEIKLQRNKGVGKGQARKQSGKREVNKTSAFEKV